MGGRYHGVWTAQGWLYLAVVLDLYSRMVVGWAMKAHRDTELAAHACTWRWHVGVLS